LDLSHLEAKGILQAARAEAIAATSEAATYFDMAIPQV
jgi:hypothetical protein